MSWPVGILGKGFPGQRFNRTPGPFIAPGPGIGRTSQGPGLGWPSRLEGWNPGFLPATSPRISIAIAISWPVTPAATAASAVE
jgi:hypothetical protein